MLSPVWMKRVAQLFEKSLPFDVTHHIVPIPRLPKAFEGFKLVQVSDMHVDCWNRPVVEAAVDVINGLRADVLMCTGDTIAHGKQFLNDVTYLLSRMQARHGKLACLGNHDYSDGDGSLALRAAMTKAGFDLLINDSTRLTVQHQQLQLAGADDLILGKQCLASTHRALTPDLPTILLSHNPENFEAMARFKPDLILSGHTHGGQIRMPLRLYQALLNSPYVAGLYQLADFPSRLYVNRGLGSAVFVHHLLGQRFACPTPRLAMPPEISVFHLVSTETDLSAAPFIQAG